MFKNCDSDMRHCKKREKERNNLQIEEKQELQRLKATNRDIKRQQQGKIHIDRQIEREK